MIYRTGNKFSWLANILCVLHFFLISSRHVSLATVATQSSRLSHFSNDIVAEKWNLVKSSVKSESELIANNYVSGTKDKVVPHRTSVGGQVQDVHKNRLNALQVKIQQQMPKESKFFDEFEGSE